MEELLTAGETAQLLRCSLRTLDRERADGRGCPFVRIGGRIRYRRADVEAFVAAHVRSHADGAPFLPTGSAARMARRWRQRAEGAEIQKCSSFITPNRRPRASARDRACDDG